MLKKSCLLTTFAILFFASATASTDRITAIQSSLESIKQAKKDSLLEAKQYILFKKRAEDHFQEVLAENYESSKTQVLALLNTFIQSNEFISTVNDITDIYTTSIVNKNMLFNDIIINPSNYAIEQKINCILEQASPALTEQSTQLFNIFYTTTSTLYSSKIFIAKLTIKENELIAELVALEAANQPINE